MAAQQAAAISLNRAHKEMMAMIRAERAAKDAANASKKVAEEEVRVANAAKEEAERKLKECIQPVATPTLEEVRAAKWKVQYREDLFHFAVAGVGKGGKSSLINAFRGLRNKDIGSAATGVTETTLAMARYASPAQSTHMSGTTSQAQARSKSQTGSTSTPKDFTSLTISSSWRFKIPTYIVRSKADQHICNIMKDMGYNSEDDESEDQMKKLYQDAREQFIQQTPDHERRLENANMPDQKVYIVSNETMLGVVKDRRPRTVID